MMMYAFVARSICRCSSLLLFASAVCLPLAAQTAVEDQVNLLIGTANEGQTYPAAGMPFAMTSWTPQTRAGETKCVSPYYYSDNRIQGFRGSHFLSGGCVPDYGSITLMPGTGELRTDAVARSSSFDRTSEHATPYAYTVELKDAHAIASITGTTRAGLMRFRFTEDAPDAWVVLEDNARAGEGSVAVLENGCEVEAEVPIRREYAGSGKPAGYSAWFVARFSSPVRSFGTYIGAHSKDNQSVQHGDGMPPGVINIAATRSPAGGSSVASAHLATSAPRPGFGIYLHFGAVHRGQEISVRIGSSFISAEEAQRNLDTEIPDFNFDRVEQQARDAWHQRLSQIQVDGHDPARTIFYTALYHAMLQPRTLSDVSGTYPRFHDHGTVEHVKSSSTEFDDYSIWDIFRAQAPLMMILDPSLESSMMQSLIDKGTQGGYLPIFPAWNSYTSEMIGDHGAVMLIDAYEKGIRNFDIDTAYMLMRKSALQLPSDRAEYIDGKGRRGLDSYLKYGYIPLEDHLDEAFHKNEQISRTLEYAYDDAMLGDLAAQLGHDDDAATFRKRGSNWRNVIDPTSGYARGRYANGTWITPFEPEQHATWITEGLPVQYTFFVPQDIPGLIDYLGGRQRFLTELDTLFAHNAYDQGNEPSHHIAYLYALAGDPAKTQQHVRQLLDTQYADTPAGIPGNDDAGQISAWYVMSALGFYQVCPGRPVYTLAAPRFDHISIRLPNGHMLRILAPGAQSGKIYASKITFNGKPITNSQIQHAQLMDGGTLQFVMSDQPLTPRNPQDNH
ncbi:GH92 family glycosyl hydrolase [Silvibacterium sp.]|uniref:GH92 family glycosyl hydrolase n=1 Tax=Silvibacterium sp. TaxID=1964179 RepID=UPI0039E2EAB8